MLRAFRWVLLLYACAAVAQTTGPAPAPPTLHHVLGLEGAHAGAKGTLAISDGALVFTPSKGAAIKVGASTIEDVSIGNDSKRTFSGVGQVTMLAPYGSGRFLSLFRDKLDVLTVAYRDQNGGLHGAIFSMKPGQAVPLKEELLAAGAKSSSPLEEAKEKVQPAGKKENK